MPYFVSSHLYTSIDTTTDQDDALHMFQDVHGFAEDTLLHMFQDVCYNVHGFAEDTLYPPLGIIVLVHLS